MVRRKSSYEDLQKNVRGLKMPGIEVWINKYPDREYTVQLHTQEVTCICPKTGLPDFLALNVAYGPEKLCVELKSFKLYLTAFRNVGIFHEHIVNKILDDFVAACAPRWAKVEAAVNPRGGITATVAAEYKGSEKQEVRGKG